LAAVERCDDVTELLARMATKKKTKEDKAA